VVSTAAANAAGPDLRCRLTVCACIGENRSHSVVVYDPAGWAVAFETSFEGSIEGYSLSDIVALTASLPAPVYDPAEYERGE